MSGNTLEDAIRDRFEEYLRKGHLAATNASPDLVIALASAVNTYLGRESNEGEKAARRDMAVAKILQITCSGYHLGASADVGALDAIVKEAQG